MNREAWLQAAVAKLRPLFLGQGLEVPELHVSCGFPSRNATGTKKRAIGECWDGLVSSDGKPQLFISPFLVVPEDAGGVLATLVHEIIHATIGCEAKHGPKFKAAMKKLGLEGKPTATVAGEDLMAKLHALAKELGPYPHAVLTLKRERKVQTTRMKKAECPCCGYLVRLAQKWADVGVPKCPADGEQLKLEEKFSDNPDGESGE